jgi:hypothetical protein
MIGSSGLFALDEGLREGCQGLMLKGLGDLWPLLLVLDPRAYVDEDLGGCRGGVGFVLGGHSLEDGSGNDLAELFA